MNETIIIKNPSRNLQAFILKLKRKQRDQLNKVINRFKNELKWN